EMLAATRAASSDSMAAKAATASAGPTSPAADCRSTDGRVGAGRPLGSSPITSTGSPSAAASTPVTTIASSEPGNFGAIFNVTSMITTTMATSSSDQPSFGQPAVIAACTAETTAFVLSPGCVP